MSIVSQCSECGAQSKFADADEGVSARCRGCGATIFVGRKATNFVAAPKPKKKKKRTAQPQPGGRVTDADRQEAVRTGRTGARIMFAALIANLLAFGLMVVAYYTARLDEPDGVVPNWIVPLLGLGSNAALLAAILQWRRSATAIERGAVVQVGVVLGLLLFVMELARIGGYENGFLDWIASYGRLVFFTLLVVYLERVCVLANRPDLQELANKVLSCGVGVIAIALIQQTLTLGGVFFLLGPLMIVLSIAAVILWIVWCFEYFRLLMFATSL
jgi:DNA-directed RNA polymerase subunit RPC12/RpoP/uncharacterized membrane protein